MQKLFATAAIVLAAHALSTESAAQSVYRCGSNYSQTPCPDAAVVDVEDTRSKAQKTESDARVRRDATLADAMEKNRLQEEARALASNTPQITVHGKKSTRAKNTPHQGISSAGTTPFQTETTTKKSSGKKKEPEFFTARVTPEKKKTKTPTTATP